MKLQVYITQPFEQSNFKWKWTNRLYKKLDLTKINFYDPQYEEQRKTGKSLIEDIDITHNYFINKDYNKLQKTSRNKLSRKISSRSYFSSNKF